MKNFEYEINYFKDWYIKGNRVLYSFDGYAVTESDFPSRGQNFYIFGYGRHGFELIEFADTLNQAIDLIFKIHFDEWVWAKDTTITRCPHCGKEEIETRFYKLRYRTDENHILCHTLVNENGIEISIQKPLEYDSTCNKCYEERVKLGLEEELPF